MKISNPYKNIGSMVRHRAISHEHTYVGDTDESIFQNCINRGIDIFAGVSYHPAAPQYPAYGWMNYYEDWEFELDSQGNIVYELDGQGNIKTKEFSGVNYPIPVLNRVTVSNSGSHQSFTKLDGTYCDVNNLVQIPNAEHAFFTYPSGGMRPGTHLNFLGTVWGDAVNGSLQNLNKYNSENGLSLKPGTFRQIFPLWTLQEVITNVNANLPLGGKVFGTINHPGYSHLSNAELETLLSVGGNAFKALEIYNNTDTAEWALYNISFYDNTLLRGHKLWLVACNDWGAEENTDSGYPQSRGCNLMYLPASYENASLADKAEMALDAYIAGCFAGVGYGTVDIQSVNVENNFVSVTFNQTVDRIIVDIDGVRETVNNKSSISLSLKPNNKFVRFEAYKDDDFIFTQPFFVEDGGLDLKKISVLFDD